jgi:uncharacterized membrane protein (DUF485 family)
MDIVFSDPELKKIMSKMNIFQIICAIIFMVMIFICGIFIFMGLIFFNPIFMIIGFNGFFAICLLGCIIQPCMTLI